MPLICTKGRLVDAARNGDLKSVESHLHSRFFKPDWLSHNPYNKTALTCAAYMGHTEIVKALIKTGADVNVQEPDGRTPLTLAATKGHLQTVIALVEGQADVNLADADGNTPLHCAVAQNKTEVVKYLLSQGAKTDITNHRGRTAQETAYSRSPVANLFEKYETPPAKKEASPAEFWVRMGTDKIAHVGIYPGIQKKITEVFNFTSREKITNFENTVTKVECLSPAESFDNINEDILRDALKAFKEQQGVANEDFVLHGKRTLKK